MDGHHFDALAKRLSSRRTAIGGLLAGLLLPLEIAARGKGKSKNKGKQSKGNSKGKDQKSGKGKGKGKGKAQDKGKTNAQAETCWRAGACIPKKGANVSQCNLAGYTAPSSLNCTGCNISRANLRGAILSGANFTKANLSGACLIDADFTGAIFANNTNLANAVFCRTIMPDGTENNSGCTAGTACCSDCAATTCAAQSAQCGSVPDGCGGLLQCGSCSGASAQCIDNQCVACSTDTDCTAGQVCCSGNCQTSKIWSNLTTFGAFGSGPSQFDTPFGVATSPDGLTVWVSDFGNDRISVWARPDASSIAWENKTTFGAEGSASNQLQAPYPVAVSPDTLTVWVPDSGNGRISVWRRTGPSTIDWAIHTTFGEGVINGPRAVAVTPDGLNAWVNDSGNQRISVWKRTGSSTTDWVNVTNFGSGPGSGANQFQDAIGLAVSPNGQTVWVGDTNNNRVSVWGRPNASSNAWENQTSFGQGDNSLQRGVTVSPDTLTVWVADANHKRISVWTRPDASSVAWENWTTFGQGVQSSPRSVAVTPDGRTAWVGDLSRNFISVWELTCPA